MDNQTFMGLVIAGGIIIVLLQNKENNRKGPESDMKGPDPPSAPFSPPDRSDVGYRTDLLRAYRAWKEMARGKLMEYEQNMRPIMVMATSHPNVSIREFRRMAPQFETMFPQYIEGFRDLLKAGEDVMVQCNLIQDHNDPAFMTHLDIQNELAPISEIFRTMNDFWDMLNRRASDEGGHQVYGPKEDKGYFKPMDTVGMDEMDGKDFFTVVPSPLESFLDAKKTTPGENVTPWFSAVPVQSDQAEDTRNFSSPSDTGTKIPALGPSTFNTTKEPLSGTGKPKLSMNAQDKAPAKPQQQIQARPGRPEGSMVNFDQGLLPSHRVRADETEPEPGPLTEAMVRMMTDAEKEKAVRDIQKRQARERGALGMIDFEGRVYTLKEIEEYINRLDMDSRNVPTSVEAAIANYDTLSNAVRVLDGLITADELATGRFSQEEARGVKVIANQALARYQKMMHDNYNVSVKKRNEKSFPSEWLDEPKQKKPAMPAAPGSG